jgi:hypothetical protein
MLLNAALHDWNMTGGHHLFGKTCCLHLQGRICIKMEASGSSYTLASAHQTAWRHNATHVIQNDVKYWVFQQTGYNTPNYFVLTEREFSERDKIPLTQYEEPQQTTNRPYWLFGHSLCEHGPWLCVIPSADVIMVIMMIMSSFDAPTARRLHADCCPAIVPKYEIK